VLAVAPGRHVGPVGGLELMMVLTFQVRHTRLAKLSLTYRY
jgi:hypothetical protein